MINDVELRKSDKRELTDFKQKISSSMDTKAEQVDIQSIMNSFTADST